MRNGHWQCTAQSVTHSAFHKIYLKLAYRGGGAPDSCPLIKECPEIISNSYYNIVVGGERIQYFDILSIEITSLYKYFP